MALLHCIAVCILATTCLAAAHIVKRQARVSPNFDCPLTNGTFSDSTNCAKFYQCTNELATLMDCPKPLLFNPNTGYCDWPNVVRDMNPGCQEIGQQEAAHATMCNTIPDGLTPGWAFKVQAPNLCNAFYTCGAGFLYAPCLFCGQGLFFDPVLRECVSLGGAESADVCSGLQFIAHADQVARTADGTCWPFINEPNPLQAIADKLALGGNNNSNRGNNRGNNNNNYNRGGNRGPVRRGGK